MSLPAVSRFVLCPHVQAVRRPLEPWAAEITARLCEDGREPVETVALANAGALVLAYAGRLERAESACRAQLAWTTRTSARRAEPALLAHAASPFVNLGRLAALRGNAAAALAIVGALDPRRGDPVKLGPLVLPPSATSPELADRPTAFVLDTLRVLHRGDPAALLAFVTERAKDADAASLVYLAEARVVALCLLGRAREAAGVAALFAAEHDGLVRTVFLARLVEAHLVDGDAAMAANVHAIVGAQLRAFVAAAPLPELFAGLLARRASELASLLGLDAAAARLAELAADLAERLDDEVLRIEVADMLAPTSEHHGAVRGMLRAGTAYRRFRAAAASLPALDELDAALHHALA